jgi:hypothetical protein
MKARISKGKKDAISAILGSLNRSTKGKRRRKIISDTPRVKTI